MLTTENLETIGKMGKGEHLVPLTKDKHSTFL